MFYYSEMDEVADSIWDKWNKGQKENFKYYSYITAIEMVRRMYLPEEDIKIVIEITEILLGKSKAWKGL